MADCRGESKCLLHDNLQASFGADPYHSAWRRASKLSKQPAAQPRGANAPNSATATQNTTKSQTAATRDHAATAPNRITTKSTTSTIVPSALTGSIHYTAPETKPINTRHTPQAFTNSKHLTQLAQSLLLLTTSLAARTAHLLPQATRQPSQLHRSFHPRSSLCRISNSRRYRALAQHSGCRVFRR